MWVLVIALLSSTSEPVIGQGSTIAFQEFSTMEHCISAKNFIDKTAGRQFCQQTGLHQTEPIPVKCDPGSELT